MKLQIRNVLQSVAEGILNNFWGIIAAAGLGFWLIFPTDHISNAFYATIVPIVIFLFLYWRAKIDVKTLLRSAKKSDYVWSGLLFALFLVMIPVGDFYKARLTEFVWLRMMILAGYSVIFMGCAFLDILVFLCGDENQKLRNGVEQRIETGSQTGFAAYRNCFFAISVVSLLYVVSCYPGLLHGDGWHIWRMAIGEEWLSDWHPVGYTFFCRLCSWVWNNPFSVIIAQTAIWIYVNWYILFILDKYIGKFACRMYTAASFVTVMSYYYLHVLYKDVIFSSCFLGFTVSMVAYIKGEKTKRCCIQMVVFGILAALFRHMMIVPVLVGMTVLCVYQLCVRRKRELLTAVVVTVCICVGYLSIRGTLLKHATENPRYVKYTVALQMMGAYASNGDVDSKSKEFMEQYVDLEVWSDVYEQDPYFADRISRTQYGNLNGEQLNDIAVHGGEVIKVNWRFFTRYPLQYIRALFRQTSVVWRLSQPDDYGVWVSTDFNNAETVVSDNNPEWNPVRNYATEIIEPLARPALYSMVLKQFAFYGGFGIYIIVMCVCAAFRKKEWSAVIGAVPVILLILMLLITVPCQDSRYILPVLQIAVLYFALFGAYYKKYVTDAGVLSQGVQKRNYYWIFIVFVVYFIGNFVRTSYIESILTTSVISFENPDEVVKTKLFDGPLYYADGGAWFSPEYTIVIPYRVRSDMILQFEGYCCSDYPHIEIYVNDKYVAIMEKADPELNMTTYSCTIPREYFRGTAQTIEFRASPSIELNNVDSTGVYKEFEASFYMTEMKWIVQE